MSTLISILMNDIADPKNFYHIIFTKSNDKFEQVRQACLQEDNWLRQNFLPENFDLNHYKGYSVIFDNETDEPVAMAGLFNPGRYPVNVAQHLHREYLFPKYRRKTFAGLVSGFALYNEHIVKPLNELNNFNVYFVAMQNRYKKRSKGYWEVFSSALIEGMPGWKLGEGYLQTCPANVQKCWQNYVYFEQEPGLFNDWQKKTMSQEEWDTLIQGD
jgi:hypothetical protein